MYFQFSHLGINLFLSNWWYQYRECINLLKSLYPDFCQDMLGERTPYLVEAVTEEEDEAWPEYISDCLESPNQPCDCWWLSGTGTSQGLALDSDTLITYFFYFDVLVNYCFTVFYATLCFNMLSSAMPNFISLYKQWKEWNHYLSEKDKPKKTNKVCWSVIQRR